MASGRIKLGAAAAVLLLAGGGFFLWKRSAPDGASPDPVEEGDGDPAKGEDSEANEAVGDVPVLSFTPFTTELKSDSDDDQHRVYLGFDLEVKQLSDRRIIEDLRSRVREAAIEILADRTPESVRGSDGMDEVKRALLDRVNDMAPGDPVKAVYIETFVVQ